MAIFDEISEKVQRGRAREVENLVKTALESGEKPEEILNSGLLPGMNKIGELFMNNEVFVPEVLVASRAMNKGLDILKPELAKTGTNSIGKAILCTVKGDMHDIGKNLVRIMLEGQGIECYDLGVDIDAATIIEKIRETNAEIICLSALLTTTMHGQKDIIDGLKEAGLRDKVYVMVGGAPVTQEFADEIGADCYTLDAASAAVAAKNYLVSLNEKK